MLPHFAPRSGQGKKDNELASLVLEWCKENPTVKVCDHQGGEDKKCAFFGWLMLGDTPKNTFMTRRLPKGIGRRSSSASSATIHMPSACEITNVNRKRSREEKKIEKEQKKQKVTSDLVHVSVQAANQAWQGDENNAAIANRRTAVDEEVQAYFHAKAETEDTKRISEVLQSAISIAGSSALKKSAPDLVEEAQKDVCEFYHLQKAGLKIHPSDFVDEAIKK